jgi:predicted lipoprotein with Yx(FWY)xxD motif
LAILIVLAAFLKPRPTQAPPAAEALPVINTAYFHESVSPVWGRYLTDAAGRTLYVFTHDKPGLSRCDAKCQVQWSSYGPNPGDNSSASMAKLPANVGIYRNPYGVLNFTWRGQPLYRYSGDASAGDLTGVTNLWHIVNH